MTLLNSKFSIETVDSPIATAALSLSIPVDSPPSPSYDTNGTPVAGSIYPGMIVKLHTTGKLVLATAPDLAAAERIMPMIAVDGNVDFGGRLVQVVTCIMGGITIKTDQYTGSSFVVGAPLTFSAGKFAATGGVGDTHQRFGYVGPDGFDAVNGILHVVLPQGV